MCVCVFSCLMLPGCGLTLAENPQVVNALLAHITHLSPLEASLGEGVTAGLGKLQADRRVSVSSQTTAFQKDFISGIYAYVECFNLLHA